MFIRNHYMVSEVLDEHTASEGWQNSTPRSVFHLIVQMNGLTGIKQRFQRFRSATKLDKEDGEIQVSSLIYAMGNEVEHIFKSFTFNEEGDKKKFDVVLRK